MVASRSKAVYTAHDLSWTSVWQELSSAGWYSRKPPARSLETGYRYVRPGGDPNGRSGIDYFVGKIAVLENYANTDGMRRQAEAERARAEVDRAADVAQAAYARDISNAERAEPALLGSTASTSGRTRVLRSRRAAAHAPATPSSPSSPPTPPASPSSPLSVRPSRALGKRPHRATRSVSARSPMPARSVGRGDNTPSSPSEEEDDYDFDYEDDDDGGGDDRSDGSGSGQLDDQPQVIDAEALTDSDDGLNVVKDGDEYDGLGALDSGDEDDAAVFGDGEFEEDVLEGVLGDEDRDDVEPGIAATEAQAVFELKLTEQFLQRFGGEDAVLSGCLDQDVLRRMATDGWEAVEQPDTFETMQIPYEPLTSASPASYPGLRDAYSGPSADALRIGNSPVGLFFFFLPVSLWEHIATCTNTYFKNHLEDRVSQAYKRHKDKGRRGRAGNIPVKSKRDIYHKVNSTRPFMSYETCRFVGLLMARTIAPNREKLAHHWKTVDDGAITRGTFGKFLARDRFMDISRNLHFSDDSDATKLRADRAWKIRHVVATPQKTFARGYVAPSQLSFDEAMLPSRSSFNKMRVYMKDKPHKWGTKLFMLCSAVTAYCIRFEVYVGKKQNASDSDALDMKTGQAAVVRNLLATFGSNAKKDGMRLVVVDRFYTSVWLALQLLLMGFYVVGTIMTNRLGYCKAVIESRKSRPDDTARGEFKYAVCKTVPCMRAISWWDSRPVHFLCTGGSVEVDRAVRKDRTRQQHEVPCPRVIKDYQELMGGVDVHDQLRLQRYSLQRACRFRKYYKSLVLGLIDMAIVNGYIVHKAYHANKQPAPLSHVHYMKRLHHELCQLVDADMYDGNTFGADVAPSRAVPTPLYEGGSYGSHRVRITDEWRNQDSQPKRRQLTCKVCSALSKKGERAATSPNYCDECSPGGLIFLCTRARRKIRGVTTTCWDVSYREWRNGALIPLCNGALSTTVLRTRHARLRLEEDLVPDLEGSRKRRLEQNAEDLQLN